MKGKIWDISSLEKLNLAVKEVLAQVRSGGQGESASVLALSGDLGAGKTTFTQYLAKELGVSEAITSPTFVIMKKYPLPNDAQFKHLVHIDAYRLESPEELLVLNFNTELHNKDNLVVIEWAEKVVTLLPPYVTSLSFNLDGAQRSLSLK
ncbi:tRNA (adenosine(37)-N6)-threonylcarbamoyltransferase complex ATPase subunit type 1 TsaE [Candidatus Nomurabacteria bacterium]|nr:tRNA (adenosine(37)-N6)-threonylcarbamoyltransferase complex ATPase subunit type 1 TsaE [Candidatus Nomurabacteria bacterium]MCB9819600.1 tRNA (adenosine(37)-N6)-threonylcarbamoyltransferase complex ATPase subunit type 1 TsaE [Candidatus Nomurabacteria bacterium]